MERVGRGFLLWIGRGKPAGRFGSAGLASEAGGETKTKDRVSLNAAA